MALRRLIGLVWIVLVAGLGLVARVVLVVWLLIHLVGIGELRLEGVLFVLLLLLWYWLLLLRPLLWWHPCIAWIHVLLVIELLRVEGRLVPGRSSRLLGPRHGPLIT